MNAPNFSLDFTSPQYLRQKWTVLYGLDISSEYDKHTALTGL